MQSSGDEINISAREVNLPTCSFRCVNRRPAAFPEDICVTLIHVLIGSLTLLPSTGIRCLYIAGDRSFA